MHGSLRIYELSLQLIYDSASLHGIRSITTHNERHVVPLECECEPGGGSGARQCGGEWLEIRTRARTHRNVPQPHTVVSCPRDDLLAIWREGDRPHIVRVARELRLLFARLQAEHRGGGGGGGGGENGL
jgi:hypothetical protein